MPRGGQQTSSFTMPQWTWFLGVVEDRNDPEQMGRVKVRMFGYHTPDTQQTPGEGLVWAAVMLPPTSSGVGGIGASSTGLVEGSHVVGFFLDGEAAQSPVIIGVVTSKTEKKNTEQTLGFKDPKGIYPRYEQGESNTNKLARGKLEGTVVEWRKKNLDEADKAGGGTFKEPETPYAAKYPYNHVKETEPSPGKDVSKEEAPGNSGHIQEFDDTPGAERVYLQHKKGTFTEWHPDGTEVHKVKGDQWVVVEKDGHLHIKGEGMITIDGGASILMKGETVIESQGNVRQIVKGNYTIEVDGSWSLTAKGGGGISAKASGGNIGFQGSKITLN